MVTAGLVILDRDGVLNADSEHHIKSVAEFEPLPGSLDAVARLTRAGYRTALATNQSGIGRGLFTEADLAAIHDHLATELARRGGRLELIRYAPDAPGSPSPRRKPGPGMLIEIADALGVELADVPYVGDSGTDIDAARAAGARPVLVRSGRGAHTLATRDDLDDVVVYDDLAAFVDALLDVDAARAGRCTPDGGGR